jgi:hypothetical protein
MANGLLALGSLDGYGIPTFSSSTTWAAPLNAPLVNAAPVISPADSLLYIFSTGLYRLSAVFVARCNATAEGVASLDTYEWWNGTGWAMSSPSPLLQGPLAQDIGELAVVWHEAAQLFLLCFFSFSNSNPGGAGYVCQTAAQPEGPWSAPVVAVSNGAQPWWGDYCCGYGGYIVPGSGSLIGSTLTATVVMSLWVPYRSFAFTLTINNINTATTHASLSL